MGNHMTFVLTYKVAHLMTNTLILLLKTKLILFWLTGSQNESFSKLLDDTCAIAKYDINLCLLNVDGLVSKLLFLDFLDYVNQYDICSFALIFYIFPNLTAIFLNIITGKNVKKEFWRSRNVCKRKLVKSFLTS